MGTSYRGSRAEVEALNAFVKLARAARTVQGRVNAPLAAVGLTVSQFGALEALFHLGPMNQRRLAAKILKSTGNITVVLDNLERRGLAARVRDAADRRNHSVKITEKGADLVRSVMPGHVARIVRVMGALTRAEQGEFARLCRKLGLAAGGGGSARAQEGRR